MPLVKEEQRQHLDRLAEPHVVGQAYAELERRGEREPRHADLLIWAQRAVQVRTGIDGCEAARPAQSVERLREPRARLDAGPAFDRARLIAGGRLRRARE